MNRVLICLFLMLFSSMSFATDAPMSGADTTAFCVNLLQKVDALDISQQDKAGLIQSCLPNKDTNASTDSAWSAKHFTESVKGIGEAIAVVIGDTAKQLNITVNEFIKSPAGMLTVGILVLKLFGAAFIRFFVYLAFFVVLTKLYIWAVGRCLDYQATYETKPVLWGLYNKKIVVKKSYSTFSTLDDNTGIILAISSIIYFIASFILVYNIV